MLNTLDYLAQLVMTPALATADILNDEDRAKYGRIAFWLSVVISTVGSFLLNPELGFDPLTFVSTVLITGFILYVGIWISTWIMYTTLRIIRARTESVHVQSAMIAAYFTTVWASVIGVARQTVADLLPLGFTLGISFVLYLAWAALHVIATSVAFKVPIGKVVFAFILQMMAFVLIAVILVFMLISILGLPL